MISFKDYNLIEEAADAGLAAKAKKSGISIETLRKVYRRGVAAWNSGHRPGTTPQQWGMARVNSYITKGKGTYGGADKDLHEDWSQKYKSSINCAHPKGFSQKAHCAGKKKQNESIEYEMICPDCGISEGDTSKLPRVDHDKKSGLPKKYVAGLSTSTAKARAAHWDKMDKLSDNDPRAYEPAPGDANAKTKESKHTKKYHAMFGENMDEEIYEACWDTHKQVGMKKKGNKMVPDCVPKNEELSLDEQFDIIEKMVIDIAQQHNLDPEMVWEKFEDVSDEELFEAAVDAKGYKSSTGGLTQKGRDSYNREHGSNLKAPVTTPPSKLKAGSKAANRRKSFCARMGGMEGPLKKPNGEPTRKALALRKWNC